MVRPPSPAVKVALDRETWAQPRRRAGELDLEDRCHSHIHVIDQLKRHHIHRLQNAQHPELADQT